MISPSPKVALIAGPTASGKSALAMELAERRGGIVINADSAPSLSRPAPAVRPAVRGGRGARAAPAVRLCRRRRSDFSAARWAADARAAIAAAHEAGRLPVLVGGTGLYLRTLLDGIAPVPEIDRDRCAPRARAPVAEAHAALRDADPDAAARLNCAATRRAWRGRLRWCARPAARSPTGRPSGIGGIGDGSLWSALVLLPDARLADRALRRAA